jgi:hypothetical protein
MSGWERSVLRAAVCAVLVFLSRELAAAPGPELTWEDLGHGASYAHVKIRIPEGPVKFFVVRVNLAGGEAEVLVTPPAKGVSRTSKFAQKNGLEIAINGGFWDIKKRKPLGLVVSGGEKWPGSQDDALYGFFAVSADGHAWISPPEDVVSPVPQDIVMALAGAPMIVRNGAVDKVRGCGLHCLRHPRAAVGLDQKGETLFLVVADGRQPTSVSISLSTLARFMIDLGAWNALNLDGGGSATMVVEQLGGVVNSPCEGRERSVLTHLGVKLGGTGAGAPPQEMRPAPAAASAPAEPPAAKIPAAKEGAKKAATKRDGAASCSCGNAGAAAMLLWLGLLLCLSAARRKRT